MEKFMSDNLRKIVKSAEEEAMKYDGILSPEIILLKALSEDATRSFLISCGSDVDKLEDSLKIYLGKVLTWASFVTNLQESYCYKRIKERAKKKMELAKRPAILIQDIIASIYEEEASYASEALRESGVTLSQLRNAYFNSPCVIKFLDSDDEAFLSKYTTDLSALAKEGKSSPVIGREKEINIALENFCRFKNSSAVLVGEAGTGKTSIAEGVALRIVEGDNLPKKIKNKRVLSLEVMSLTAGTRYRGSLERRLRRLINILTQMGNVILFIDELHTLVGAGGVSGSALDASNMLKPALASGKITILGCTTHAEIKHIEKDRALMRRFQKIEINEPSEDATIEILKGLKEQYMKHHDLQITDKAIESAVLLSNRYITDEYQPHKSIAVLDKTAAHISCEGKRIVDQKDIERQISQFVNFDITVEKSEKDKLRDLEKKLSEAIFGQDFSDVVKAVKRSRAFPSENPPIFLLAGPTGTGKSFFAKTLAKILFDDEKALIRIDCSEYSQKHTISRLIGAPPGYAGYGEQDSPLEIIRRRPFSAILFDEVEKASLDLLNLFLQIHEGRLTDGQGRTLDLKHAIIILTSNLGSRQLGQSLLGFTNRVYDDSNIDSAISGFLSPELRNRLVVVKFNHLSREVMVNIVMQQIDTLAAQLLEKNVSLTVTEAAINQLAELGHDKTFGARHCSRIFDDKIKSFFVDEVLFGRLSEGGHTIVDWRNGEFCFDIQETKLINKQKAHKKKKAVLLN